MEIRTDYPDVPLTTVAIASAVRRKIAWKVTAKDEEYGCTTATKTKESGVPKKQDEGTS